MRTPINQLRAFGAGRSKAAPVIEALCEIAMISFSDIEFQRTKLLLKGQISMEPIANELSQWISITFNVSVLNVIFDTVSPGNSPRIQVVLEYQEEVNEFRDDSTYGYCKRKTSSIIDKLSEVIKIRNSNLQMNGAFVIFSAFAPLAKQEAFSKIEKFELEILKERLNNKIVWEIPYQLGYPVVFLYTNAQLQSESMKSFKELCNNEFFKLIKPFDEFNYLKSGEFQISFESKENFDRKYGGSWHHYWHG